MEIMLPLIAYEKELEHVRARWSRSAGMRRRRWAATSRSRWGRCSSCRACLVAGRIARHADFFSFGTNDLDPDDDRLSRDDVEGGSSGPI